MRAVFIGALTLALAGPALAASGNAAAPVDEVARSALSDAHKKLQDAASAREQTARAADVAVLEASRRQEEERLQNLSARTVDERKALEDQRRRDAMLRAQAARQQELTMHQLLRQAVEGHLREEVGKRELTRRDAERARREAEARQLQHYAMLAAARRLEEQRLKEEERQQELARKKDEMMVQQLQRQQEAAVAAAERMRLAAETRLRELAKSQETARRHEEARLADMARKQAEAIKKAEAEQTALVKRVNEQLRREQAVRLEEAIKREELVRAKIRFDQEMKLKKGKLGMGEPEPTDAGDAVAGMAIAPAPGGAPGDGQPADLSSLPAPVLTALGLSEAPSGRSTGPVTIVPDAEIPPVTVAQVASLERVLDAATHDCKAAGGRTLCNELEVTARTGLAQARQAVEGKNEAGAAEALRRAKGQVLAALSHRF